MKKPKEVPPGQITKITGMYEAGSGLLEIGRTFGHCVSVIRRVLVEQGVHIHGRGRPFENRTDR
jgi:hypothetical protein